MQHTVSAISQSTQDFLKFAYQLLKVEEEDKLTQSILEDCAVDQPDLINIIGSNKWNKSLNKMQVRDNQTFIIMIGKGQYVIYSDAQKMI